MFVWFFRLWQLRGRYCYAWNSIVKRCQMCHWFFNEKLFSIEIYFMGKIDGGCSKSDLSVKIIEMRVQSNHWSNFRQSISFFVWTDSGNRIQEYRYSSGILEAIYIFNQEVPIEPIKFRIIVIRTNSIIN